MRKTWFTLIEMTVYITVSSIIIYWVFATYEMISNFVYKSDKSAEIYAELDNLKKQVSELQSEKYSEYIFSTGSIFSKSNYWFETCFLTNKSKTKWLVFWAYDNISNKLEVWQIEYLWDHSPFVQEITGANLANILSTNNITSSDLWWNKTIYNKINIAKLSCNSINNYFEFDITMIPDFDRSSIWTKLDQWNNDNHLQIPLTIIP